MEKNNKLLDKIQTNNNDKSDVVLDLPLAKGESRRGGGFQPPRPADTPPFQERS